MKHAGRFDEIDFQSFVVDRDLRLGRKVAKAGLK
jgi:hypothetical protein